MKKVLLSLLAVAALVLSCQNYDDEFDALNAKVSSLESQISSLAGLQTALTQVQSSVSALQAAVSAIPDLSTEVTAILADLSDLETAVAGATTSADLDALKAELNTTLAALQTLVQGNAASIASLVASDASLKADLAALGVDVDALLAQGSTYTGNLNITNAAEVAFAAALGSKVAVIEGDVKITLDEDTIGATDVNAITSLIKTVVGNVLITTDQSFDLSGLTSVSGDYIVDGHDINDANLASTGDILLDYDGAYTMTSLTTAGDIYLVDFAEDEDADPALVGTTSVNFVNVTSATSMQTVASGSIHSSGGSGGSSDSDGGFIVAGAHTDNNIVFAEATSVKIGDIPVVVANVADATEIELHYDGDDDNPLASLAVTGAELENITIMATYITGALNIAGDSGAAFSAPGLVEVGGATSIDSETLSIPVLEELTGTVTIANVESLSAPVLDTTGEITAVSLETLDAPELAAANLHSTTDGITTMTVASISTSEFGNTAAVVETLTLTAQAVVLDLSAGVDVVTLSVTGDDSDADITIGGAMAELASLTLAGELGEVTVGTAGDTDGLPELTSFATSGTMIALTITDASELETVTLNHLEDEAVGTSLTVNENPELTTFTTSFDRVVSFIVTDNPKLDSFDASSIQTVATDVAANDDYVFTITGNNETLPASGDDDLEDLANFTGLKGSVVEEDASNELAYKQNSLLTLKPYLAALLNTLDSDGGNIAIDIALTFDFLVMGSSDEVEELTAISADETTTVAPTLSDVVTALSAE